MGTWFNQVAQSQNVAPLPTNLPFRLVSGTIGQGAYAFIRKACPLQRSQPVIAVKFINKSHVFQVGRLRAKQLNTEIILHRHLEKHQNIIQFINHGEDVDWLWIAMELADGGDLFDKIEADQGVGEDVAHFYFSQLISAVSYMHDKGVAHRDIKPENILLSGEGDLKLADFGLATLFQRNGQRRLCNTICGSPPYMAPEILDRRGDSKHGSGSYDAARADIWSSGIVLFVLLVGNTPWDEPSMTRSYEFAEYVASDGHTKDELWDKIPPGIRSLLRGVLKVAPEERFSLEEIRRHPWFARANPHLSPSGRVVNPVMLATQMLEALRIDLGGEVLSQKTNGTALQPEKWLFEEQDRLVRNELLKDDDSGPQFAASQPAEHVPRSWMGRPTHGGLDLTSLSQPVPASVDDIHIRNFTGTHSSNGSAHDRDMVDHLSNTEPSLTQFASSPGVPLSLTQQARRFRDVLPAHSMARFFSRLSSRLLLGLIHEALCRMGFPPIASSTLPEPSLVHQTNAVTASNEANFQNDKDEPLFLQFRGLDSRKQRLHGIILIETLKSSFKPSGSNYDGLREIRFVKSKGDPVEWRRVFKRVVLLCRDAVLTPPAA